MRKLLLNLVIALAVLPSYAADLAVLRNGNAIRHERHEVVGAVTRLYMGDGPTSYIEVPTSQIEHFEKDLTPPPPVVRPAPAKPAVAATVTSSATIRPSTAVPLPTMAPSSTVAPAGPMRPDEAVNQSSRRYRIDPDLINSVIHAESGFNPKAVSPKGAQGLMQLMPKTAAEMGVKDAFEPGANVDGGTKYLRELLERYDFDIVKALAAYNAGPHRVEQYRGVPPYYETRAYVARIVREFNRKKLAQRKAAEEAKKKAAKKPAVARPAGPSTTSQQASVPAIKQNTK